MDYQQVEENCDKHLRETYERILDNYKLLMKRVNEFIDFHYSIFDRVKEFERATKELSSNPITSLFDFMFGFQKARKAIDSMKEMTEFQNRTQLQLIMKWEEISNIISIIKSNIKAFETFSKIQHKSAMHYLNVLSTSLTERESKRFFCFMSLFTPNWEWQNLTEDDFKNDEALNKIANLSDIILTRSSRSLSETDRELLSRFSAQKNTSPQAHYRI